MIALGGDITTGSMAVYYSFGDGRVGVFIDRNPTSQLWKVMPCGHSGLLVHDKWVCQVCWSWEVVND